MTIRRWNEDWEGARKLTHAFCEVLRHYLGAHQSREFFSHSFEWVMSRIWVLHVTPMVETCPHIWKNNLKDVNESWCPLHNFQNKQHWVFLFWARNIYRYANINVHKYINTLPFCTYAMHTRKKDPPPFLSPPPPLLPSSNRDPLLPPSIPN